MKLAPSPLTSLVSLLITTALVCASESSTNSTSTPDSSNTIDDRSDAATNTSEAAAAAAAAAYLSKEAATATTTTTSQDQRQPTQSGSSRHQQYPNHQSYPSDTSLNAKYSSVVSSLAPSGSLVTNQSSYLDQLNLLLNRDHHESSSVVLKSGYKIGLSSNMHGSMSNKYGNHTTSSAPVSQSHEDPIGSLESYPRTNYFGYSHLQPQHSQHQPLHQLLPQSSNQNSDNQFAAAASQLYASQSSPTNAGMIQQLTASLFPVKQLSNATLHSLSELLNKTKQTASGSTNAYRPNSAYNRPASGAYLAPANLYQPSSSPASTSYLSTSSSGTHASHLSGNPSIQSGPFDFLSQFGLSETADQRQQQQQRSQILGTFRPHAKGANYNHSYGGSGGSSNFRHSPQSLYQYYGGQQQIGSHGQTASGAYRTYPSNVYNTYLPYGQADSFLSSLMTNGQALKQDSQPDAKVSQSLSQYKPAGALASQFGLASSGRLVGGAGQANDKLANSQQYIQHYSTGNRDQLDRIVYNSTPFRPSIVNPPPVMTTTTTTSTTTPASTYTKAAEEPTSTMSSTSSGLIVSNIANSRPRTEADNKSVTFASLGSSSSSVSDSKPNYKTNGQAMNTARYSQVAESNQNRQASQAGNDDSLTRTNSNGATDYSQNNRYPAKESGQSDSPSKTDASANTGDQNRPDTNYTDSPQADSDQNASPARGTSEKFDQTNGEQANRNYSISSGSPLLFDLYEREVDNQIREALAGLEYSGPDTPIVGLAPIPAAAVGQPVASWTQPMAVASQASYVSSLMGGGRHRPGDSLTAALQDLPNFSAADLQPMMGASSAYSLLPGTNLAPTSLQDSLAAADAASMDALASQLIPIGYKSNSPLSFYIRGGRKSSGKQASASSASSNPSGTSTAASSSQTSTQTAPAGDNKTYGLQSILAKLYSSPLASLISNPLTHLYARLPSRGRSKKTTSAPTVQNQQSQQQQAAQSSDLHSSIASLLAQKGFFGVFRGAGQSSGPEKGKKSSSNAGNSNKFKESRKPSYESSQATDLLASEALEHQWTPLQALLQQQASNGQYLDQELSYLTAADATAATSFLAPGKSQVNSMQPLVLRNLFPSAHWNRKHSSGRSLLSSASSLAPALASSSTGQTNRSTSSTSTSNSLAQRDTSSPLGPVSPYLSALLDGSNGSQLRSGSSLDSLAGADGLASHLFAGPPAPLDMSPSARPKLTLKILNLPQAIQLVQTPSADGGQLGLAELAGASNHLGAGALLTSLPCPLHSGGQQQVAPHSLEQHFQALDTAGAQASPVGPPVAQLLAGGFTDTSQPNDLQPAPSGAQFNITDKPVRFTSDDHL